MDLDKNCGVCIHSDQETGRFCVHERIVADTNSMHTPVAVARGGRESPCGPDAALFEACACLEPFCPRHGKDRRR